MHLGLSDQTEMNHNIELTEILSLSFMCNLPTSGERLGYCQSVRARDSVHTSYRLPELSTLEKWSSEPRSSMLLTQNSSADSEKLLGRLHCIDSAEQVPNNLGLAIPKLLG
jgi:hypothetical protein